MNRRIPACLYLSKGGTDGTFTCNYVQTRKRSVISFNPLDCRMQVVLGACVVRHQHHEPDGHILHRWTLYKPSLPLKGPVGVIQMQVDGKT